MCVCAMFCIYSILYIYCVCITIVFKFKWVGEQHKLLKEKSYKYSLSIIYLKNSYYFHFFLIVMANKLNNNIIKFKIWIELMFFFSCVGIIISTIYYKSFIILLNQIKSHNKRLFYLIYLFIRSIDSFTLAWYFKFMETKIKLTFLPSLCQLFFFSFLF